MCGIVWQQVVGARIRAKKTITMRNTAGIYHQKMELIDIGCNLTHDSFDVDRGEVIEAAKEAGVVQMIVTGASAQGSLSAVQLASEWPQQLY